MTLGRTLAAITRGALLVCAVAVPLVWCPWTSEALEVNKQTVTVVLVVIATICALSSALAEKRFVFRHGGGMYMLIAALAGAVLVSALLSGSPYLSLVGEAGQEYASFLTTAAFALFAVLGAQYLADTSTQRALWSWSLLTSGLVGLSVLPNFFGRALFGIANTVGTPNALAVYLVSMATLGFGLWLTARGTGERDVLPHGPWGVAVRAAIFVTGLAATLTLLAIDYWVPWALALVGMGTLFAFALVRAQEFPAIGRFVPPMLLFVFALVFLFIPSVISNPFLSEAAPTQRASWAIVTQTLGDSHLFFGSGPGTFVFDYAKFHDAGVNASTLWDVRFDRAASHVLTILATEGIIGLAAYLLVFGTVLALALSRLLRERVHDEWKMTFAPFAAWLALFVGQFLYASNMTLSFVFWLLTAVLLGQALREVKEYPFALSPRAGLAGAFAFVLAFVVLVTSLFVTSSRYAAEVAFAQAISLDRSGASIDEVIMRLDAAALRNRWSDIYYRNLGHALLLKTADALQDETATATYIQQLIGASISASRRATELSPGNVVNWELQGDVYREVSPVVADAAAFAVASYTEAIALASNNPKYFVDLAQAYLVQADQEMVAMESDDADTAEAADARRTEALDKALAALLHAKELKGDYLPAGYYLASVYERQGELKSAIASMETVKAQSPLDIGVAMQLALLYLQQGKNDLAKAELERALEISPNYSNARWYLATILEGEGDLEGAIAQLEAVAALNPDNTTVTTRLENLRAGLAAAHLPPPIEEDDGAATESPATPTTE